MFYQKLALLRASVQPRACRQYHAFKAYGSQTGARPGTMILKRYENMKRLPDSLILIALLAPLMSCGGGNPPLGPPPNTCNVSITGTLRDRVSSAPISGGRVALEVAVPPGLPLYEFSPVDTQLSGADGGFRICATSVSAPAAVVVSAPDGDKAYPPLVVPVSGSADLGELALGECGLVCIGDLNHTDAPAVISGTITSPVALTGDVHATFAMYLPSDDSYWRLVIPSTTGSQTEAFSSTAAGTCPNGAPFCGSYTLTLPPYKPFINEGSVSWQEVGPPVYLISVKPDPSRHCTLVPPIVWQEGALLPLTGNPGAHMVAATAELQGCR